jgi:hypothetical protein
MPVSRLRKNRRKRKLMSTRDINVNLSDLINSMGTQEQPGPLTKLLNARLPAALAFRLSMLTEQVQAPAKHYNAQRESLLQEHGKSEDGQHYNFEGEGWAKFQEALAALGTEEVTVKVPSLKIADLGEREILTPAECYVLRWLFEGE